MRIVSERRRMDAPATINRLPLLPFAFQLRFLVSATVSAILSAAGHATADPARQQGG